MPKFRFQVLDPKLKSKRIGTLEAKSIASARQVLVERGYAVDWVKPAGESPKAKAKKTISSFPVPKRNYRPPLRDQLGRFSPDESWLKLLLGAGTILGILLLIFNWEGGVASSEPSPRRNTKIQLTLRGRISNHESLSQRTGPLKLTLQLPQLPYTKTWESRDLLDDAGRLELNLEFESSRPAGLATIILEKKGYKTLKLEDQILESTKSATQIDIGSPRLQPIGR